MDYRNVINTAVKYFEFLGDSIHRIRMSKPDKMFTVLELNALFINKLITESALNAHIWVIEQLTEIERLAEYAKSEWGKVWNTPTGNEIIKIFAWIGEKKYKERLEMRFYSKRIAKWENRLADSIKRDNIDDIMYCSEKLEMYAMSIARDEPVTKFASARWFQDYIESNFIYDWDNVSQEYKDDFW